MKVSRSVVGLAVLLVPALLFAATDLTGTWSGPMANGAGQSVFHLTNDKAAIGGTMVGQSGKEYPISDGKLDGDNISFSVAFEWQGMPVKLLVTGKVSGEQMQLHIAADNGYWATDATVKREGK